MIFLVLNLFWNRNISLTDDGVLIDWRLIPWATITKVTFLDQPTDRFDQIILATGSILETEVVVAHNVTNDAFNVMKKKIPNVTFEYITP